MFHESLLESSPNTRKNKRWSMATAFTLEFIVASVFIAIPLLSTGVIQVSARAPHLDPLPAMPVAAMRSDNHSSPSAGSHATSSTVVSILNSKNAIYLGPPRLVSDNSTPNAPLVGDGGNGTPDSLFQCDDCQRVVTPPLREKKPVRVSNLSEAQLIYRVEPVYPHIATLTRTYGVVQLHAIIARDGTIQSLNVTSGPPLLAQAARDAVRQWRYRPYFLNGEAVEVETFVTVNFRPGQ